jgi:hypothetical protein
MECETCAVYGRKGLGDGSPSFLFGEFLEQWKGKRFCMKKNKIMQKDV